MGKFYHLTMSSFSSSLSIISFNCKGFRYKTHDYVQSLFNKCDFLLIQEHWLLSSQFYHFSKYVKGACYTANTDMPDDNLGPGRPYGGTAILWHDNVNCKVDIINTISGRLSSVLVTNGYKQHLIITVYMPSYDNSNNCVEVYGDILAEISQLTHSYSDANVIIMGDWNTDFTRNNHYNTLLNSFLDSDELVAAYHHNNNNINFTYISPDGLNRSYIDHLILDKNIYEQLTTYKTFNDGNNTSDHLPILASFSVPQLSIVNATSGPPRSTLDWSKATQQHITQFQRCLDSYLERIDIPSEALTCSNFNCQVHSNTLLNFFDNITSAISTAGDFCIPHSKPKRSKGLPGWNEHVADAKNRSIFWNNMWKDLGCPRDGWVALIRRSTRAEYHKAIKKIKRDRDNIVRSRVADDISRKKFCNFWSEIKKMKGSCRKTTNVMDNVVGNSDICELFRQKYNNLYNSPAYNSNDLVNELQKSISKTCSRNCNSSKHLHFIRPRMVSDAICKLKSESYDKLYDLYAKNLTHGTDKLNVLLAMSFTAFLTHGLSPSLLNTSYLVPIPKNVRASLSQSDNYRAIALNTLFNKLFDYIFIESLKDELKTSDFQFAYKNNFSTSLCSFLAMETIHHFNKKGSKVLAVFLDASKAFDKVEHAKLFPELLKRKICPLVVRYLFMSYQVSKLSVIWGDSQSDSFSQGNGVKQGAVLSPILFAIYLDPLLQRLRDCGVGCHVGNTSTNVFAYADDLLLLAPTYGAMRELLKICEEYGAEFKLTFNPSKSSMLLFNPPGGNEVGKSVNFLGKTIPLNYTEKHLGHVLSTSGNNVSFSDTIRELK